MTPSNVYGQREAPEADEWKRLKELVQRMGYGEIRLVIQAGKPVRVDVAIKQIKLDIPADFKEGLDTMAF